MLKFIRYIISSDIILNFILFVSVLYLFLFHFVFLSIPEIFRGASTVGIVLSNICIAVISSYLFYLIVVQIKEYRDKATVFNIIDYKLKKIIEIRDFIIGEFKKEAKVEIELANIEQNDVDEILKHISSSSKAPKIFYLQTTDEPNWLQFLGYYLNEVNKNLNDIFKFMPYLDTVLLDLINEFQEAKVYKMLSPFDGFAVFTYPDLSPFSKSLYEFIQLTMTLENYRRNKLKIY